jgi:hypothetical protein
MVRKVTEHNMCFFLFSLQLYVETFLNQRRTKRDSTINNNKYNIINITIYIII